MTSSAFKYIDPSSYVDSNEPFVKPWTKVDGPGHSFHLTDHQRQVESIRGQESNFNVDNAGFAAYKSPAKEKAFTDDAQVREGYYPEVEALLREKLPGVKKVVFFDHTIRRREKASPRQPVQQVHVDQTPSAAAVRVRRHLPADEAEGLLKGRYQIINIWRPIANPASDFPLAVVDYRTTKPADLVKVDLLVSSPGRRKIIAFLTYSLLLLRKQRYMLTEIRSTRSVKLPTATMMTIAAKKSSQTPTPHLRRLVTRLRAKPSAFNRATATSSFT